MVMWNDSRLEFNPVIFNQLKTENRWYGINDDERAKIWIPRLSFRNVKRVRSMVEGQTIKELVQLTTDPDTRFYASHDSYVTISCPMNFTMFPFDQHICYVEVHMSVLLGCT